MNIEVWRRSNYTSSTEQAYRNVYDNKFICGSGCAHVSLNHSTYDEQNMTKISVPWISLSEYSQDIYIDTNDQNKSQNIILVLVAKIKESEFEKKYRIQLRGCDVNN